MIMKIFEQHLKNGHLEKVKILVEQMHAKVDEKITMDGQLLCWHHSIVSILFNICNMFCGRNGLSF